MISPLYGQLSPLRIPTKVRQVSTDADANAYLLAVEAADGQELEAGVITAVETFVLGCKSDGIWSAIKSSCILAGARTLSGALVPLVGSAPTNFNFVSGDYNRETGLKGNGSTKYLNSNRAGNADLQNFVHISVYESERHGGASNTNIGYYQTSPVILSMIYQNNTNTNSLLYSRLNSSSFDQSSIGSTPGFIGLSRNNASTIDILHPTGSKTASLPSLTPPSLNYKVFAINQNNSPTLASKCRMSFYSIGEAINLSNLKSRVSTLMTDLAEAI